MPKNLNYDSQVAQAELLVFLMIGLMILCAVVQVALLKDVDAIEATYLTLQLFAYLMLYNLPMPAIVQVYMKSLRKGVDLAFLSFLSAEAVQFNRKTIEDFGFTTYSVSVNVFPFTALMLIYVALVCLTAMISCWSRARDILQVLVRTALFNGIIVWQRLAYLRLVTCVFVAMMQGANASSITLLAIECAYPILLATVLLRYRKVLDTSPWLQERIGQSYNTTHRGRSAPFARLHQPLMLLRRLMLSAIPFIVDSAGVQLVLLLLLQVSFATYMYGARPFNIPSR